MTLFRPKLLPMIHLPIALHALGWLLGDDDEDEDLELDDQERDEDDE